MRRLSRFATAGALVVGLAAVVSAPAVMAQSNDGLLTVRGIDGTDRTAVGVTFLWTGDQAGLENLTIREDGQAQKVDKLTDLRKTEKRIGIVPWSTSPGPWAITAP